MQVKNKPIKKVVYLSGPVKATHIYQCWLNGEVDEGYFGTHYLLQFYQVCHDLGLKTHVISLLEGENLQNGKDAIEYCPVPLLNTRGLAYHIGQISYFITFIYKVFRLKADIVLVVPGRQYWFMLSILPWFGIKVIPSLHCVLWPKFKGPSKTHSFLLQLTKNFFRKTCVAILAISDDVADQVKDLTKRANKEIFRFIPTYRRNQFSSCPKPQDNKSKFSVLFVGRVETNKGIYTIFDIARKFKQENKENIVFEVCGTGSELSRLKKRIADEKLEDRIIIHGLCDQEKLKEIYQKTDVVIVPTTKEFIEGFNKVLAESVLMHKPAITSAVCPALSTVKEATIEVPPEDTEAYAEAILMLRDNEKMYEEKRLACLKLQSQFYEESNSWGYQFRQILLKYVLKNEALEDAEYIASL